MSSQTDTCLVAADVLHIDTKMLRFLYLCLDLLHHSPAVQSKGHRKSLRISIELSLKPDQI